jgi:hypothetical protein
MGSTAELLGLAEPVLKALTSVPYSRTENYGTVRVGSNASFQDGVFLMLDDESPPNIAARAGRSFEAIAYHGIPIIKRTATSTLEPSPPKKRWWQFWVRQRHQPTDDSLKKIEIGMTGKQVVELAGRCNNITTMASSLSQVKGFAISGDTLAKMSATELWVYTTGSGKYKLFLTDGKVDEIKFEEKV